MKMHDAWFSMATQNVILKNRDVSTKSIISQLLLHYTIKVGTKSELRHKPFIPYADIDNLHIH